MTNTGNVYIHTHRWIFIYKPTRFGWLNGVKGNGTWEGSKTEGFAGFRGIEFDEGKGE